MRRLPIRWFGTALASATVLAALVVIGALVAGYRPVIITTGSMGDAAPAGALVIAEPRSGTDIEVGDIVVMRRPNASPVTHRVIEIEASGTSRFAVTQGDANQAPDAAPYPLGDRDELRARWIVPGWGGRLQSVFQPGVMFLVLAMAVGWITGSTLRHIWREDADELDAGPVAEADGTDRKRRRVVGLAALPLAALSTVGVAWAFFQSSESVASNTFGTRECFDPQLGSVQHGETTHAVDGTVEVPITAVDPTEAFVLASVRSAANEPADSTAAVSLRSDGAAVVIDRGTDAVTPPPVVVRWSVVHYTCGITVQRGSVTGNDTSTVDVTLPTSVDPAASFALASSSADRTSTDHSPEDLFAADLTSGSGLRLRTDAAAVLSAGRTYHWQVISFDDPADATTQRASAALGAGAMATTITLATPVDPSTTFLLVAPTSGGTGVDIGERMVRAHLVDSTTVAIERSIGGDPVAVDLQVVTLRDGSTVRHGVVDLTTGETSETITIDPVDPSRSTALASVLVPGLAAGGLSDMVADDVVGEASATFSVTSPTDVSVERTPATSFASFGWQVIEWAGPGWWDPGYGFRQRIDVDTGVVAAPGAYTVPLTFDHAALVASGLATSPTGDDLRVVRWDGSAWTELDRVLDESSSWNDPATTIWFQTVDPIAADDTATYWLYLGSTTPAPPRDDPEAVWLLTEDFESGTLGDFEDRTGGTGWYAADPWTRRIPLTVPAGRVGTTLVDYPLLVSITEPDLAAGAQPDGSDLRFVAADGVTPLPHEIERWDSATGALTAWVRIPVLSSVAPTSLYLVYSAADAPAQSDVRSTWSSDHEAAWHLSRSPADDAPQLDDATVANHDGVSRGGMTPAALVGGVVGDALDVDGVDDHLETDPFDLAGRTELTVSAWVRLDAGAAQTGSVFAKGVGPSPIVDVAVTPAGAVQATLSLDGSPVTALTAGGAVTPGAWHHVAAVWDGLSLVVVIDGSTAATTPALGDLDADATAPVTIGAQAGGAAAFDGSLDEIRVERVARSLGWLAGVESNHRSPGAFVTVGAVETGVWFDQGTWLARKPVTLEPSLTAAALTAVAVPVTVTDADIQASATASGVDIVFTAADGTTRLDHVLEAWDDTTGTLTAWVLVPTLSPTEPTELFVYYGNPTAVDQQDSASVFGPDTDLTLTGSS